MIGPRQRAQRRNRRSPWTLGAALLGTTLAVGCSTEATAPGWNDALEPCRTTAECGSGALCTEGFCRISDRELGRDTGDPDAAVFDPTDAHWNDVDGEDLPPCDDDDFDCDGIPDDLDNCPRTANANQLDSDGDGIGDACDNCPSVVNVSQRDRDLDGLGDACDPCPSTPQLFGIVERREDPAGGCSSTVDTDGDGIPDIEDNCPVHANPDQDDSDGDGVGDACDSCPYAWNPEQRDVDRNGVGDACQPVIVDTDQDGIDDAVDNCPDTWNPTQDDSDDDGTGDACDPCPDLALGVVVGEVCVRLPL